MKKEDIIELYIKRSGCARSYAESNSIGYRNFEQTLKFILDEMGDVDKKVITRMETLITQCERYPEEKTGEHIKLIRGVFNKLKRDTYNGN